MRPPVYRSIIKAIAKQTINNVKPPMKYLISKGFWEIKLPSTRAPKVNLPTS